MAEKRMFSKTIVLSDAFLEMPATSRCLYFTLSMFADDDGFVNSPRGIMRQCGSSEDDMRILLAKKFVLAFETGVFVIKHWRINNYLRSDRYQGTNYTEEKKLLSLEENGAYTLNDGKKLLSVDSQKTIPETKVKEKKKFVKPTVEEIQNWINEKNYHFSAENFYEYYEANGWKVNNKSMKSWKCSCVTWEHNAQNDNKTGYTSKKTSAINKTGIDEVTDNEDLLY